MNITPETSIGEIVKNNFRTVHIFEKYNLDFCCGGKKPLLAACAEKGLKEELIKEELSKIENEFTSARFDMWPLSFLCEYIKVNHHDYLRITLPVITAHIKKVVNAHGDRFAYLPELQKIFTRIQNELLSHMDKEEKVLFPYIANLEATGSNSSFPPFGKVEAPISVLIREHEEAGEEIENLRQISDNFIPPQNACTTFRITFQELEEFYKDLKIHIHLENNILFPKSVKLEAEAREKINL